MLGEDKDIKEGSQLAIMAISPHHQPDGKRSAKKSCHLEQLPQAQKKKKNGTIFTRYTSVTQFRFALLVVLVSLSLSLIATHTASRSHKSSKQDAVILLWDDRFSRFSVLQLSYHRRSCLLVCLRRRIIFLGTDRSYTSKTHQLEVDHERERI